MLRAIPARRSGFTLLEMMAVLTITGVLLSFSVPKIGKSAEAVRVDKAASELRSLWRAERRYKLERGSFAPDISDLENAGYVNAHFSGSLDPFSYKVLVGTRSKLMLEAKRNGTGLWFGSLQIDEFGELTGKSQSKEGDLVIP